MQLSGTGATIGFIADMMFRSFPLGTTAGGFAKNFFNLDSADMKKAAPGGGSFGLGDMFRGLFGDLGLNPNATHVDRNETAYPPGKVPPESKAKNEQAQRNAQPRTDAEADREAQMQSGPNWKKVLLWGGAALAGITLLNRMPFFGGFSMPGWGAGMGMNMAAMQMAQYGIVC